MFRKFMLALMAVAALAIPSTAMAESPPSDDQVNSSVFLVMNGTCGHTDYMGCGWFRYWQRYWNGYHYYVTVAYTETPGWGVYYNYCATTSWWRGYYHVDNPKFAC